MSRDTPLTRPSFPLINFVIRPFSNKDGVNLSRVQYHPWKRFEDEDDDLDDRTDVFHVTREYIHCRIFC